MPDPALPRRIPAPPPGRILAAEPGRIDPAHGVGPGKERDRRPGPCPGGSPAPLPVLRAPAPAAMRRSALGRSTATGPEPLRPMPGAQHSGPARHEASEGPGIPAGHDRRKAVLQAARKNALRGALQALRPLMEPTVRRFPIGLNRRAANKDAADLLRESAGPAVRGQPDSAVPDPALRGLTIQGPAMRDGRSRDHPGPESGLEDPGRPRRGTLARMPVLNQIPADPIPNAFVPPAMPGRAESLAPAEAERDAAIAARGRPMSRDPVQPSPGRGAAALRQNQGSPASAGANRIGKNREHDRQP